MGMYRRREFLATRLVSNRESASASRIDESFGSGPSICWTPYHNCQRRTLVLYKDGNAPVRLLCSRNDAIGNVIVTYTALGSFAAIIRQYPLGDF